MPDGYALSLLGILVLVFADLEQLGNETFDVCHEDLLLFLHLFLQSFELSFGIEHAIDVVLSNP